MQPHSSIALHSARRPTLLAAALCLAFAAMAQTPPLPTGPQAIAGQATVTVNGTHMQVTTQNAANGQHSAINWQSFSVGSGHSVYFQQPTTASTVINRVTLPNPSLINGSVGSNAHVVLVNQYGITVGPGAVIDTARFTASTLAMSEADAIAGRLRFQADGVPGPLVMQGQVVARGGDVVLVARDIEVDRDAVVRSEGGAVILAAGQKVEITGRGLEGIRLEVQAPTDRVVNLGTLQGDAVGIFAGTLRHSGAIRAQTATLEGGRVVLKAQKDIVVTQGAVINADGAPGHAGGHIALQAGESVQVAGTLSAQSATLAAPEVAWTSGQPPAGPALPLSGKGGRVEVLGQTVWLQEGAGVDVSGDAGGGTILVGGDYQGANPEIPNAKETFVASGVNLVADARARGDGGKVIVWADSRTRFYGHLSARGGEFGGNGGIGETSGKEMLLFRGTADLTARRGRRGSLLLDPNSITVDGTADINGDTSPGPDMTGAGDLDNASTDYPGAASQITATALATLLNTADVTLAATNVITIASAVAKTTGSAKTLTLNAPVVNIMAAIGGTASIPLNLTVNASTSVTLNAAYSNGTLTLTNPTLTLGASAALSNVTLGSDVTLSGTTLAVSNGLQIASSRTFNIGSVSVALSGSQVFTTGGSADIVMAGGSFTVPGSQSLALSAGITVRGYGNFYSGGASSTLVNNGTIDADQTGQFLLIRPANFTNNSVLRASTGSVQFGSTTAVTNAATAVIQNDNGRLEFGSVITNAGDVNLNGGLTLLGGSLTPTTYTTGWNRNAGELRIMGTLDLGGGTLDIGAGGLFGTGGLGLENGTIRNGTLRSADGSGLSGPQGTLQNMTIGSSLSSTVGDLFIVGGLVLGDGITFDIGGSGKFVYFSGTQTISTAGQA
ncbi:MAG TPA: filamentous hemagglutinin N-terminal domain-containing protein, partial [Ramlibacter sp.]|nr:filamentous hemagglutinin N-terminal domain-containing protein [Ramlibacter sp.]